MQKVEATRTDL